MAAIFPPREGQHVFGPIARIGWGAPILVEVKLGVVIEVGAQIRSVKRKLGRVFQELSDRNHLL